MILEIFLTYINVSVSSTKPRKKTVIGQNMLKNSVNASICEISHKINAMELVIQEQIVSTLVESQHLLPY